LFNTDVALQTQEEALSEVLTSSLGKELFNTSSKEYKQIKESLIQSSLRSYFIEIMERVST